MPEQPPPDLSQFEDRLSGLVLEAVRDEVERRFGSVAGSMTAALQNAQTEAAAKAAADVEAKAAPLVTMLTEKDAAAAASLAAVNTNKAAVEASLAEIKTFNTQSKTALDNTVQNETAVVSIGKRAEQLNESIVTLQEQVAKAEKRAVDFETDWQEKYEQLFKVIEGLLPGATGASLASGFRSEKFEYEKKQRDAKWLYIAWLAILVVTIAVSPIQAFYVKEFVPLPTDALQFLNRLSWNLPLVVPAVWGAWLFVRRANLYDQLAEEYRHKEAISNAFEGYTNQLKKLEKDDVLSVYLTDALREICVSPVRVYDKKHHAASPVETTVEGAKSLLPNSHTK